MKRTTEPMKRIPLKLSESNSLSLPKADPNGAFTRIQANIPASWGLDIDELINSPESRFQDRADFVRHAILLVLSRHVVIPDLDKALQEFEDWKYFYRSLIEAIAPVVSLAIRCGFPIAKQGLKVLTRIRYTLGQLSNDFLRDQCLKHFYLCYGHLLDQKGPEREDEAKSDRLYHLIKSQIQEIDRTLKGTSTSSDVVQ